MRNRGLTLTFMALLMLIVSNGPAYADYARVVVSPPGVASCLGHYYPVLNTINAAIAAIPAGGTIFVCPGVYAEQVAINKSLTIQGSSTSSEAAAVIVPPTGGMVPNATDLISGNPISAQVLVTAGTTAYPVTITNLTVDGAGNGITDCNSDLQGILFQNASGVVQKVATRNQIPGDVLGTCLSGGEGILVQSSGGSSTVSVLTSSVHSYNTNGITGNGAGTNLTASGNYVQGSGLVSGGPVQNGIQLGFGAQGKIALNTVSDNISGSPSPASTDILLFDAAENGGISVSNNILHNSQIPIALMTDTAGVGDGVNVSSNKIFGAPGDAIDVCTNGNTIASNQMFNSTVSAVHFDTSCGIGFGGSTGGHNSASKNTFNESACAGILDDTAGTGGNATTPANTFLSVPFKIASSTAACPYVPGRLARAGGKQMSRVSPRK